MSGWNAAKVVEFRSAFLEFANHVTINSKELGTIVLGEHIYTAQRLLLDGICRALSADIHDVKIGKSRQLGVSTFSRALTTFWAGMHDGLRGYMVFDTDGHKEEARIELLGMIEGLPRKLGFPKIKRQNRTLVELSNGTIINFAAAGVREGKGSGTLGRSSGINFAHCSELCSWAAGEQIEAFKAALAEDFENRLYLWESTARGYNLWYDIYQEAKKDETHQRAIFIGWWAKDNQKIPVNHPEFERYGLQPPTDKEMEKIKEVREQYGWQITDEQLAWYRRKLDPTATADGDTPAEYDGGVLRLQEQPTTEMDMWQVTGAQFFASESLTDQANKNICKPKSAHMFGCGMEFVDTKVYAAPNTRLTELRVWEEPEHRDAVYVVSADPAFGTSETNDRSAIQVSRCYADGIDQVAEYAWPLISTRQFAWVILALAGWYAGNSNEVYLIIELNGPGAAVWDEITYLKTHLPSGYQQKEVEAAGLRSVMANVRSYVYSRPDSMTAGRAWMWKTNAGAGPSGKVRLMERMRDFVSNGMYRIRSMEMLEEMRSVTREGDNIETRGRRKDDRVISGALGVRCWEERVRRGMSVNKRTREAEAARKSMSIVDQAALYSKNHLDSFFAQKRQSRNQAAALMRRQSWRSR
jgi:hypothetical protein